MNRLGVGDGEAFEQLRRFIRATEIEFHKSEDSVRILLLFLQVHKSEDSVRFLFLFSLISSVYKSCY